MKICFIGLGSIGTRHLFNLKKVLDERNKTYKIDAVRSSNRKLDEKIEVCLTGTYSHMDQLPSDYDIIFITNPTYLHYDTLRSVISKTKHIFIEKPIFHKTICEKGDLNLKGESVYYVACPLRHTPAIKYAKTYVDRNKVFAARAICSSYLPDWRKGVDYRTVYSAKKEEGGGVTLDLIHEWDYLCYLFGNPLQVLNIKGKYSELEIESDDLATYIGKYSDKVVELHLDYFGRKTTRELTLYTKEHTVCIDIISGTVNLYGVYPEYIELKKEDMYLNEMNYFLDLIEGKGFNMNDVQQAIDTLKITMGGE